MNNSIIKKIGLKPGKTVAIFAGVHGNELAPVRALDELIKTVNVRAGVVYFIYANPAAMSQQVRFINKNLNRCFLAGNQEKTSEDYRARELMAVLDKCEALLDLHTFNDPQGDPFVICETNALKIAARLDVGIVSTCWSVAEPGGTDAYMFSQDKIGLCLECGPIGQLLPAFKLAVESTFQFLQYFGCVEQLKPIVRRPQKLIVAQSSVLKKSKDFKFTKPWKSFDRLASGEVFARDGDIEYIAKSNECIIFPRPDAPIGSEVFAIGEEDNNF